MRQIAFFETPQTDHASRARYSPGPSAFGCRGAGGGCIFRLGDHSIVKSGRKEAAIQGMNITRHPTGIPPLPGQIQRIDGEHPGRAPRGNQEPPRDGDRIAIHGCPTAEASTWAASSDPNLCCQNAFPAAYPKTSIGRNCHRLQPAQLLGHGQRPPVLAAIHRRSISFFVPRSLRIPPPPWSGNRHFPIPDRLPRRVPGWSCYRFP